MSSQKQHYFCFILGGLHLGLLLLGCDPQEPLNIYMHTQGLKENIYVNVITMIPLTMTVILGQNVTIEINFQTQILTPSSIKEYT